MNATPTSQMSPLEMLSWQVAMGVDETIGDEPTNHFELASKAAAAKQAAAPQQTSPATNTVKTASPVARAPKAAVTLSAKEGASLATKIAQNANDLTELRVAIEGFDGCGLVRTAMNTVFADGEPNADIMIIGESPNADEDRMGKPFAGEIGQLLDKMMAAIGRDRDTGFYTTNIIPWRPPGNRKPSPDELAICLPFIKRHIELVKPKVLFLMGHTAIAALLDDDTPTKNIRGKWRSYEADGQKIDVMPSYHPSRLLKQPQAKRASWQDLLEIKSKIGE